MHQRSMLERLVHAISFEGIALLLTSFSAAFIMNQPVLSIGRLAICLSLIAMFWNMIFNAGFDRYFPPDQPRRVMVRILHTLSFELGMLVFAIPTTMSLMAINMVSALLMDAGFMLFFLVYTYLFNLMWDHYRPRWFNAGTQH